MSLVHLLDRDAPKSEIASASHGWPVKETLRRPPRVNNAQAVMISPTPSFYDTNSELFQPSQDTYGLWYQQCADVDNYGVRQQPYQQGIGQYPT